jgi:hypothetical protein
MQEQAMPETVATLNAVELFRLPPLILHPFSGTEDSSVLVESSRASLALQGLVSTEGVSTEDLDRSLLRGRYAELRMRFYVGKDLARWLEQCAEVTRSQPELSARLLTEESFIPLLVDRVPAHVRRKLETWGVVDFTALFRRAIGLHMVFAEPPPVECLGGDFLRRYHRYIDQWFELRMLQMPARCCTEEEFTFDLFASGEYAQMLEQTWQASV